MTYINGSGVVKGTEVRGKRKVKRYDCEESMRTTEGMRARRGGGGMRGGVRLREDIR